jgi:hypothetical protein
VRPEAHSCQRRLREPGPRALPPAVPRPPATRLASQTATDSARHPAIRATLPPRSSQRRQADALLVGALANLVRVSAMQHARKRASLRIFPVAQHQHAVAGPGVTDNDRRDAIAGSLTDILDDPAQREFFQGKLARQRIRLVGQQRLVGILFPQYAIPLQRLGDAIIGVEEITALPNRLRCAVSMLFRILGSSCIARSYAALTFSTMSRFGPNSKLRRIRVRDEFAALKAQLHGLIDGAAQLDQFIRLDLGRIQAAPSRVPRPPNKPRAPRAAAIPVAHNPRPPAS